MITLKLWFPPQHIKGQHLDKCSAVLFHLDSSFRFQEILTITLVFLPADLKKYVRDKKIKPVILYCNMFCKTFCWHISLLKLFETQAFYRIRKT